MSRRLATSHDYRWMICVSTRSAMKMSCGSCSIFSVIALFLRLGARPYLGLLYRARLEAARTTADGITKAPAGILLSHCQARLATVLGVISYTSVMQYPSYSCTVGYSLDESAQGQGIMRRALAATNQWLFDNVHIHRVCASYMPCNTRSAKVLEAVGF